MFGTPVIKFNKKQGTLFCKIPKCTFHVQCDTIYDEHRNKRYKVIDPKIYHCIYSHKKENEELELNISLWFIY
jgi:hypothetical protein